MNRCLKMTQNRGNPILRRQEPYWDGNQRSTWAQVFDSRLSISPEGLLSKTSPSLSLPRTNSGAPATENGMEFLLLKVLIGFIVGTLIGLTGLGGGVLLLPLLIFGLRVPAIIAVGTDALFNFFTKIPASIIRLRKGTVRGKVVLAMAVGSIPGSYLGVTFLQHMRHVYGAGVNDFIKSAVGLLLVLIPTLLLFQGRIEEHLATRQPTMKSFAGMSVIGLVGGFLVGITSVGSGSIIMMLFRGSPGPR